MTQCSFKIKKAETNNKYMNENYDKSSPSSYISYLNANRLYGSKMCRNFCMVVLYGITVERKDEKTVMTCWDDDDKEYILEGGFGESKE